MAKTHRLRGVDRVVDWERARPRRVQNLELAADDLDRAGRQVRVHGLGRARDDLAAHRHHVLEPDARRRGMRAGAALGIEYDLDEPRAVADVEEDDAAV